MTITFAFTIDVDNDGMTDADERNVLEWESVSAVPQIADLFMARGLPATWFVRADNHLAEVYGDAAWLLETRAALWSRIRAMGHAVEWHPHIVRRDAQGWFVPENDDARCAAALHAVHDSLRANGHEFIAVRIGEAFHGNQSMRTLSALGYRVDSSALPSRKRNDSRRYFDWQPTPNRPYHPSAHDYRVGGDDPLAILEVPMTSVPVEAPYDPRPLPRYLNLSYRRDILSAAFARHLRSLEEGEHTVVTVLHPEEVLPHAEHGLYAYEFESVEANLDHLLATAASRANVRVVLLSSIASLQGVEGATR